MYLDDQLLVLDEEAELLPVVVPPDQAFLALDGEGLVGQPVGGEAPAPCDDQAHVVVVRLVADGSVLDGDLEVGQLGFLVVGAPAGVLGAVVSPVVEEHGLAGADEGAAFHTIPFSGLLVLEQFCDQRVTDRHFGSLERGLDVGGVGLVKVEDTVVVNAVDVLLEVGEAVLVVGLPRGGCRCCRDLLGGQRWRCPWSWHVLGLVEAPRCAFLDEVRDLVGLQDCPGLSAFEDAGLGGLLELVVQVALAGLEGVVAGEVACAGVVVAVR